MKKNVAVFYGMKNINGPNIYMPNMIINIYRVTPALVLDIDEQLEDIFYAACICSIKMIKVDYQILVNTSKLKFDKAYDNLSKIEYKTKNEKQKTFICNYKEYIKKLADDTEIYERSIYIIVRKMKEAEEKQFVEGFKNLSHLSIRIQKVTEQEEIMRILYECINKNGDE